MTAKSAAIRTETENGIFGIGKITASYGAIV